MRQFVQQSRQPTARVIQASGPASNYHTPPLPDWESPQNIARLKRDRDFAEEVGKVADAFDWPTHGRKPVKIPFLVSASIT